MSRLRLNMNKTRFDGKKRVMEIPLEWENAASGWEEWIPPICLVCPLDADSDVQSDKLLSSLEDSETVGVERVSVTKTRALEEIMNR
jgi:hypothetical protein